MIKDIDEAIKLAKENCPDEYAIAYLNAIDKAIEYGKDIGRVKDAFEVQLLYAYSNMEEWEGDIAKEVKGFFKEFLKDSYLSTSYWRNIVIVREQMKFNCIATKSWLNSLFVDNFNNADILIRILRLIARIDYLTISPEGTTMALTALAHSDTQVKECGIRAFESWCSIESLKVLENLTVQPDWLQDYVNRVVDDLREELNVTFG